jgi:hypothetical protein
MPNKTFPMHLHHRDARCFKCGGALRDLRHSGFAPQSGQYRGACAACGISTWYDCAEGSVELIRYNEGEPSLSSVSGGGRR